MQTDLLKLIELGEDSNLELKAVEFSDKKIIGPHRNSLADELAAMANSNSATLILGVDDKTKDISGIPRENMDVVETWVREICNDLIEPPLDCIISKVSITLPDAREKLILKVAVPKSLFVHKSPGGYFKRIGSSKREMKPDALARLFQHRSQVRLIRFDEQVVHSAALEDLDSALWNRFRTTLSPKDDREFLLKMKLISPDGNNNLHPTVSGILMCSHRPDQFLPNAYIQAVCYKGTERNADYQLDAKDIAGPLDYQIKEACKFVERNMRVFAEKKPNRIELPEYSLHAVFEAVVNAVAHRDYSIYSSKIRLHLFADRLELFSPGNIANSMTLDSLSERQSARNELLSSLLARCPMNLDITGSQRNFIMDKRGEGVPIIILRSLELSGRRPEYTLIDDEELKLVIYPAQPAFR